MENIDGHVEDLYLTDEYVVKNPSLHEEDSPWKIGKIKPLIDRFADRFNGDEIDLLDVGGGAGVILDAVSTYTREKHGMNVNKFALDLSPAILEIQRRRNPDLKKALNEDIRRTSLGDKEIDLTLLIDVLEHVPDPEKALEELARISKYVIFKVPLEDNLLLNTSNYLRGGKPRQHAIETIGHINVYNFDSLRREIEEHTGRVLDYYFTNVFEYLHNSQYYKNKTNVKDRSINLTASYLYRLSPRLCSLIFCDFVMVLVECY